jgi:hypothetical protein
MKKHLIFDFETMGTDINSCAVIDCSVLVFDWDRFQSDNPYSLADVTDCKKIKLDVKRQVQEHNFKIEPNTLEWWGKQSKDVRKNISPKPDDVSVSEFCDQFMDIVIPHGKITRWWARSNTFDPIILWRLFETAGKLPKVHEYLPHYFLRDTRTWIDAKLNFPKKNGFTPMENQEEWDKQFKAHDSSWDVLADVLRMQLIDRVEFLD